MPALDYFGLFDASPNPYLVLDRALNIVAANRAYLESTKRALADIVGRWAWDAFPTDPQTLKQSIASFERVIRTGKPDTMPLLRFDIPRPDADGGGFEKRYWSITHTPVFNSEGEVELVMQHPIDVTELEQLRDAARGLHEGELDLVPAQSGIFIRAQNVHEANLQLQADSERLHELFEKAPSPIAVLTGKEHVFELANEAYFQLIGRRDIIGKPLLDAVPEVAGQGFDTLLDQVRETGRPFVGRGMRAVLQQARNAPLADVYLDFLFQPLFEPDGSVAGIFCQINDVTEAYQAQAALRESQDRLREGMHAARMVVWDWDLSSGRIKLSDNAPAILGCASDATDAIFRAIHPDDGKAVRDLHAHATPDRSRFKAEFRFVRPDNGNTIWLENRARVVFGEHGAAAAVKGVVLDITERKRAEKQVQDAARHDSLTGLPNRALLHEYCEHILALATRSRTGGALLFIDLDRFKPINDLYGHDAGDMVLREVAQRLSACTRREDIVSRLGGDEFIVVLPNVDSPHDPATVARHIIAAIERPVAFGELQLVVSPSIGISLFPEHGKNLEELIRSADLAMYAAKKAGRNTFKFYEPCLNDHANGTLQLETQLKRCVDDNRFTLHYQPIVDIRSRRLEAAEALIRMPAADGALLSPAEFIPIAEKAGLINRMGEWVIREACQQHQAWKAAGLPSITISINVSATQFRQPAFTSVVADAIRDAGIDPAYLQIELTESTVMDNVQETMAKLRDLRSMGVRVSLDDFGTGYCSLSDLSSLPLDKLKIDRSFVGKMESSARSRSVTEAIIALGRTLHLKVVGEGIESEESMNTLRDFGCDEAQGFLFSKPLPPDAFASWCRAS
ncbi:MAG TPA: EAL domain-containing protein [Noviherbaspirillum sp.]|uniref:sensor domain-containing protein n=1 Tax=Noviherbaspirillum sp. TaxID=1926288 RepID=UPI002D3F65F7|nr:EAL domain-containing protein [Noviherbaspirillum sp.]HYD94399.1 EAL domain-containing protein [Noviherbaspirillum sp.]